MYRLSARAVPTLGPGKYADGAGLWLYKPENGAQWVLRYNIHGRRREMGLGSATHVSLKEAREAAEKWRAMVRAGKDPIKERERQRREDARNIHLLKDIAEDAFEARKAELKGDGKAVLGAGPTIAPVNALTPGAVGNADAGARLSLSAAIAGVEASATVVTLAGGIEAEGAEALRARVILGFRADQAPPMPSVPVIDQALLASLVTAEARPVAVERATATPADLAAKGSPTVQSGFGLRKLSGWIGIGSAAGATDQTGLLDQARTGLDQVDAVKDVGGRLIDAVQWGLHHWWIFAAIAAYLVFSGAGEVIWSKVREYRAGAPAKA